ncbi:efflux transporter outer membrane subunit [Roseateles sp. DXS20W]|uniref:Efflux transporter outer membrane subunit n=1 Tax=Pelomonas lactea TaxID=3299030 RepID=A0ABW7GQ54_9BURK
MTKFLTILAASLALAGCASMAPTYERPAAPVAAQWPVAPSAAATQAADLGWREFFTDTRLQGLIDQALANNRDLRVAVLNVQRAQAQYGVQQADRLPTVNAAAAQSATRSPGGSISRQYSATLGVSAWELDLFGRVKSLSDAALQQYLATDDARRSAQVSLVAEVAGAYLTLAADQERLRLAEQTLLARQEGLRLTQRLQAAGVASTLDLRQAEIAAETAQTDLAGLTTQVAQDRNALTLLVGQPLAPEQLPVAGTDAAVTQTAELAAGLPSDVLLARPDVQQAERTLQAANANIGAARAAFFPRISLTASAGSASNALDGLFRSGSGLWTFMPQVSLPIFDAGRNRANLTIAQVDRDIAVAQYEKAIQAAFRDVADALAQRATIVQQVASQQRLVAQTQDTLRLAEARFAKGVDDRLATLDAQRSLYGAEQGLINARLAQQVNRVTLYKALGGGQGAAAAAPQSTS